MNHLNLFIEETFKILLLAVISICSVWGLAHAGSLTPSSSPGATGYTLGDIYNKIQDFSYTASAGSHSLSTSTSPASSFRTTTEIWNLLAGQSDLTAGNIKTGATILGVDGSFAGGGSSAAPLKTGQTICYDPSGDTSDVISCSDTNQDGDLQRGVSRSYTNNGDNTVTDSATGLMWIQDPEVIGGVFENGGEPAYMIFADAITNCEALDYAGHTDWHLPNITELLSLIDYSENSPSIDPIFSNTQTSPFYWSSTTYKNDPFYSWQVFFTQGFLNVETKTSNGYPRCVRG